MSKTYRIAVVPGDGIGPEIVPQALEVMEKALAALDRNFGRVRTGRASLTLLDGIRVDYYGTPTALNQVASLSIPEPRLIMLRPYDPSIMADIEKAIVAADLGLNPQNDGKVVRIPIPPLTEDRRRELVKVVEREAEASKVVVRNVRRDVNKAIDGLRKGGKFPEDDCYTAKDAVQKHTDEQEKEIQDKVEKKRNEILEV